MSAVVLALVALILFPFALRAMVVTAPVWIALAKVAGVVIGIGIFAGGIALRGQGATTHHETQASPQLQAVNEASRAYLAKRKDCEGYISIAASTSKATAQSEARYAACMAQ